MFNLDPPTNDQMINDLKIAELTSALNYPARIVAKLSIGRLVTESAEEIDAALGSWSR